MVRDFKRPEGRTEAEVDANGDGELLVVLDLRPDTDLQVSCVRAPWTKGQGQGQGQGLSRRMLKVCWTLVQHLNDSRGQSLLMHG